VTVVDGNPAGQRPGVERQLGEERRRRLVPAQQFKAEPVDDEQADASDLRQPKHVRRGVTGQRGEDGGGQVDEA